ncbi:MAG: hypothetical protein U0790_07235 [Isosphaeraceae bacterium]
MDANPRVELCYLDHNDQVRITGTAKVVNDPTLKREVWETAPISTATWGTSTAPNSSSTGSSPFASSS